VNVRNLVFLCVQNSARSQMAEGLARASAPRGLQVWSAGSHPYEVRPQVGTVLSELGIDSSGQHSKGIEEVPIDETSLVITLCAEQICPAVPGARVLHWPIDDPATGGSDKPEEQLQRFRKVRDHIRARIDELLRDLD